ncbi:MAG TPA: S-layer homology domain-containing protein [Bacillota bacterium]
MQRSHRALRRLRRELAALGIALLAVLPAAPAAGVDDEPYPDVRGHWAEDYIEVLRDEGVTDGIRVYVYRPYRGWGWETYYRPDRDMLTDEWVVLAAKVFDLPAPKVDWTHRLEGGQEVARWLAAADRAGWPYGRKKDPVTRVEAVDLLIEALGLAPYAASLSPSRVDEILSVYKDDFLLKGRRRRPVAAATLLGIVEGYPDHTFRPDRRLTRAEGATILARSALARADASPNPFYPDGDGYQDETVFTLEGLRNRNLSRWQLAVTDRRGSTLWKTGASRGSSVPLPAQVVWDGVNDKGKGVRPGEYYYRLSLWDLHDQRFDSALKPLIIGQRSLEGGLSPLLVDPGAVLSVWADTWGDATQVKAILIGEGAEATMTPQSSTGEPRRWTAGITLPAEIDPGPQAVLITARFGPVTRSLTLPFTVRDVLGLEGWLDPTSLAAGETLDVWAETTGQVDAVTATFEDGTEIVLARQGPHRWQAAYAVPAGTPVGSHPVLLRARGPAGTRQRELWFEITGDLRARVQALLTD